MDFEVIIFDEYKHIEVEIGDYTIRTDQSKEKGGTGSSKGSYSRNY